MQYFTGKGDDGFTNLSANVRLPKNNLLIEAMGSIDELTSVLGLARSFCKSHELVSDIIHIQRDLSRLMAEVQSLHSESDHHQYINAENIEWLERQIRAFGSKIKLPSSFILPGDTTGAAMIDFARTTTRRVERQFAALKDNEQYPLSNAISSYLNRLSSLLFVMELYELYISGISQPTQVKNG